MKYNISIVFESKDKAEGDEGIICNYGLYETDNWKLGLDLTNSLRMTLSKILDKL